MKKIIIIIPFLLFSSEALPVKQVRRVKREHRAVRSNDLFIARIIRDTKRKRDAVIRLQERLVKVDRIKKQKYNAEKRAYIAPQNPLSCAKKLF